MSSPQNKVILITGGSSGIGRACAFKFGAQGYSVVISGRNQDNLNAAVEDLKKQGINTVSVAGDVSVEADCNGMVDTAISEFGRLDVLVNNAGMSMRALFKDVESSVIVKLMEINFFGTLYCTKFAMPHLLKSKGSVIGVSSIAGFQGLPGRTGYSASKFAMQGFLDALRIENRNTGLHVLTVCPGFTESNIRNAALVADGSAQGETPRNEKEMMTSEEVAEHIFKATQARKPKLVLTNEGKMVSFLSKFFPRLVDKLVFNAMAKEPDSPLNK